MSGAYAGAELVWLAQMLARLQQQGLGLSSLKQLARVYAGVSLLAVPQAYSLA